MERIIFHVDVNSAFLSWSAVKRLEEDPDALDLRTIPSAVGGDVRTRHGVITAKSIPAKKFGIKTGEPVVSAMRKCPGLILVRADFEAYRKYSRAFLGVLNEYSDQVEQASIDEAYIDMTQACRGWTDSAGKAGNIRDAALCLADEIRRQVRERFGFTVNVGISSNKLLAKMASDFVKPDKTHTLWPEEVEKKMWPLPIGDLYGCGEQTSNKLRKAGVLTIGDAARMDPHILIYVLGQKAGDYIHRASCGISQSPVKTQREEAKSYSNEVTTSLDIRAENYHEEMPPLLKRLSEKVSQRMKKDEACGSVVFVSVKTAEFSRRSRQTRISSASNDADLIFRTASELMGQLLFGNEENPGLFDTAAGVRLVGVGMSGLEMENTMIDAINKRKLTIKFGNTDSRR